MKKEQKIIVEQFFERDPLWFKFEVVVCNTLKQYKKYIEGADKEFYNWEWQLNDKWGWYFIEHEWQWIIILRTNSLSTLSHELVHLVMHVFDNRAIPINIHNDEIFAYYYQYYFNIVREKIKFK